MISYNKTRVISKLKKKLNHLYQLQVNPIQKRVDLLFIHRCLFKCKHCFQWKQDIIVFSDRKAIKNIGSKSIYCNSL